MSEKHSIAKAAGIVGSGTLISRILGFVRDVIIAALFGTSRAAQAFVVAFKIPNLLRDLVGEGATNAAFVPVLTEYNTKYGRQKFWELARAIFNMLLAALILISAAGIVFAPFIIKAIAPGFTGDIPKFLLAVKLTRILFPYLILIGLTAYSAGILNSLRHFTAPAFGQGALNICVILSALFLCPLFDEPIVGLAVGVLLGGLAQLLINVPVLVKKGAGHVKNWVRPSFFQKTGSDPVFFTHPAARKIGRLLLPRALTAGVYHINVIVDTALASLAFVVGEGAVAAIYFASRIFQFPLAIFGRAIATAALPSMSQHAADKDLGALRDTLSFSLRSAFFIMIPASAGLLVLAHPITQIIFQRGEFSHYSTSITALALLFYSLGLFMYAGIRILVFCFYSMQDTMTPVKTASLCVIVNFILNIILMQPLGVGGLALATSISAACNFTLLLVILRRRIGTVDGRKIFSSTLKMIIAAFVMGLACFSLYEGWLVFASAGFDQVFRLGATILIAIFVYFLASLALGLDEARVILKKATTSLRGRTK